MRSFGLRGGGLLRPAATERQDNFPIRIRLSVLRILAIRAYFWHEQRD